MKKILFLGFLLFSFPLMAREIETDHIELQAMDKITGRVKKIVMPVGSQINFEELTIQVDKCLKKPPEEAPENAAFLTMKLKQNSEKELFKGWMFSSNPSISAMEDPVYDIWVVSCFNREVIEPEIKEVELEEKVAEPSEISEEQQEEISIEEIED